MSTPNPKLETREGVALGDLRTGMDVQAPEGQRRWYRILNIEIGGRPNRRRADVEVLGGKHAGTRVQISLLDYEAGYKVRVPAAANTTIEPAIAVPPENYSGWVAARIEQHSSSSSYVTYRIAFPTIADMDRYADALDTAGVEYARAGGGLRHLFAYVQMAAQAPAEMVVTGTVGAGKTSAASLAAAYAAAAASSQDDKVPTTPAADSECDGCGGVLNVTPWWDGEQVRYADPECAETLGFTELPTFAAVVAAARDDAGLTAAEFDYQLNLGTELGARAYQGLGNAIYRLANEGQPEVAEGAHDVHRDRVNRDAALRTHFAADIDRMVAEAKAKSYTGWSTASAGPVRYA